MSVKSQVQTAEQALRQALINALAEGDEEFLSELFTQYQAISDLSKKVTPLINSNFNFDLSSPYLGKPGGDLDAIDNLIDFPGDNFRIPGGQKSDDVITFGDDVKIKTDPDGNITFS